MTNQKNNSKGFSLFLLVVAMVFIGGIVVGVIFLLSQRISQSTYHNIEARALYLAEAGFNDAWWELTASLEVNGNDTTSRVGEIDSLTANYGTYTFTDGPKGKCWAPDPHVPMVFDPGGIATTAETCYAYCKDVRKMVTQGLRIGPFRYALFAGGQWDGGANPCRLNAVIGNSVPEWGRGDVFINGNARIDQNVYGTVYVPSNCGIPIAGATIKKTDTLANSLLNTVVLPQLTSTDFYDYYITGPYTLPNVNIPNGANIDLNSYPDCVYFRNGNLDIGSGVIITNSSPNIIGIIAATGRIRFFSTDDSTTYIADNIHIIAGGDITLNDADVDVIIGSTAGRSGNILYSKGGLINGIINIGAGNHRINGSIIVNRNVAANNFTLSNDTILGIVYVRQGARMNGGQIAGSVVFRYTNNNYVAATRFEPSYLPYPLSGYYLRNNGVDTFPFTETEFGLPESLFTVRKIPHTWSYK